MLILLSKWPELQNIKQALCDNKYNNNTVGIFLKHE